MILVCEQCNDLFSSTVDHLSETWSPCSVKVKFFTSIVPLVMNAVRIQKRLRELEEKRGDMICVNGDDSSAYAPCSSAAAWLCNETSCNHENGADQCLYLDPVILSLFIWQHCSGGLVLQG